MKMNGETNALWMALDAVEGGFSCLRRAPLTALAAYYVGSVPFVLALLYFWSDMANDAFAYSRVGTESLAVTLLFFWMKTWQAVYGKKLTEFVTDTPAPSITLVPWLRIALRQGVTHAAGLVVLPITLVALVPFGYAYAFFQNATVHETGEPQNYREYLREIWEQARIRPMQNHLIIWLASPIMVMLAGAMFFLVLPIMQYTALEWTETIVRIYSAILIILVAPLSPLGIAIAVNIAATILFIPELLRMLAGIETAFTLNTAGMLTPSFFILVCGLTYLCLDPLVKAAYVLRCFHGDSIRSGRDLRVRLNTIVARSSTALFLVGIAVMSAPSAEAQESIDATRALASTELDHALDRVLEGRDYAWRAPRERPEATSGAGRFMQAATERIAELWRGFWGAIQRFVEWMTEALFGSLGGGSESSGVNRSVLVFTMYALLAALVLLLGALAWHAWRRRDPGTVVLGEIVESPPDLEDEGTSADELPEDGWLILGAELLERGEYRLAMRAFFLARLARIAHSNLVRIARHKSNREYIRELGRVAHAEPKLVTAFQASVATFEAVWYGIHETTRDGVERFAAMHLEGSIDES